MGLRIDPRIRAALDATGAPWEIREGARHHHVIVAGRLAGILPKGNTRFDPTGRAALNLIAQVRRAARGQKP